MTNLSHLRRNFPKSLDKRIGQRGEFNPTALLNYHNQETANAADSLRRLIERTFGDNADTVKAMVRDRYDDADIPDADENSTLAQAVESLKAITAYYHQVHDEIEEGVLEPPQTEPATIYEMAQQLIESKRQWTAGESVTIWKGKTFTAYVNEGGNDGGGLLYLGLTNGQPGEQMEVIAGILNPLKGWRFTLTSRDYDAWAKRVKWLCALAPAFKPDITMDFGKFCGPTTNYPDNPKWGKRWPQL